MRPNVHPLIADLAQAVHNLLRGELGSVAMQDKDIFFHKVRSLIEVPEQSGIAGSENSTAHLATNKIRLKLLS